MQEDGLKKTWLAHGGCRCRCGVRAALQEERNAYECESIPCEYRVAFVFDLNGKQELD